MATESLNAMKLIDRIELSRDAVNGYVSKDAAHTLLANCCEQLGQWANLFKRPVFRLIVGGEDPLEIPAGFGSEKNTTNQNLSPEKSITENLTVPELDIDLNELYQCPYPVYISQLSDQSVIFANLAALQAQEASPAELARLNGYSLNHADELHSRMDYLNQAQDKRLTEYEYRAFRWTRNAEDNRLFLKEMDFVSNFRLLNFLGVDCRLGVTLQHQPILVH